MGEGPTVDAFMRHLQVCVEEAHTIADSKERELRLWQLESAIQEAIIYKNRVEELERHGIDQLGRWCGHLRWLVRCQFPARLDVRFGRVLHPWRCESNGKGERSFDRLQSNQIPSKFQLLPPRKGSRGLLGYRPLGGPNQVQWNARMWLESFRFQLGSDPFRQHLQWLQNAILSASGSFGVGFQLLQKVHGC